MLDKSVPFADVMMHRKKGIPVGAPALPPGYSFCLFFDGDERHWARLEASVLEFADAVEALCYFQETYLPYREELGRRCLFIRNDRGQKVATAMAWWSYTGIRRDPWMHWVAVHPAFQGIGLGKAVAAKAVQLLTEIEGERDFYLHTQTWSHKAIRIYQSLGFEITSEQGLAGFENTEYHKALKILADVWGAQL